MTDQVYINHDKTLNNLIHIENRVTDVLKNLRDKREISIEQYKGLNPSGLRTGIIHALATVHKIYKLSQFLFPMLEPLTNNQYTIKDSFTFVEELQSFDFKLVMVSFDIVPIFTKIPFQEKIEFCVEDYFKDRTHGDNLSINSFCELLARTMSESLILFDKKFYKIT